MPEPAQEEAAVVRHALSAVDFLALARQLAPEPEVDFADVPWGPKIGRVDNLALSVGKPVLTATAVTLWDALRALATRPSGQGSAHCSALVERGGRTTDNRATSSTGSLRDEEERVAEFRQRGGRWLLPVS